MTKGFFPTPTAAGYGRIGPGTAPAPVPKIQGKRGFFPAPTLLSQQGVWVSPTNWEPGGGVAIVGEVTPGFTKHSKMTVQAGGGAVVGWTGKRGQGGLSAPVKFVVLVVAPVAVRGAINIRSLGAPPKIFIGKGGAQCAGSAESKAAPASAAVMSGGALVAGDADVKTATRNLRLQGRAAGLASGSALAEMRTRSLRYSGMGGGMAAGEAAATNFPQPTPASIEAQLPVPFAELSGVEVNFATLAVEMPSIRVASEGGEYYISAPLPVIHATVEANSSEASGLLLRAPTTIQSDVWWVNGHVAEVNASLHRPLPIVIGLGGFASSANSKLTRVGSDLSAFVGANAHVAALLPLIQARAETGAGSDADYSRTPALAAFFPAIVARINVRELGIIATPR